MDRNKKVAADASLLNNALVISSEIDVHAESLRKESTAEDAQKVVKLVEEIQGQETEETCELLKEVQREEVGASEASKGNKYSHIISDSITELDVSSPSLSLDKTSTSSPTTMNQKKTDDDVFVPIYPSVIERKGHMAQC